MTHRGPDQLGGRLRKLRRASGLTLAQLAEMSGVSRSMISEVERSGRAPTVMVLDRLATAMDTSLARLLQPESPPGPVVLARGEQPTLVDPAGWERRILSPALPGVEFEFMRTTLGPGVDAGEFAPHAPGSREHVAVETGTLRLRLDGAVTSLSTGDSIYFPGDCRHAFANPGRRRCVYYLAMDITGHHRPLPGGNDDDLEGAR